ncbi:hypothetical protein JCM10207_005427 [Rhodosporidiobolus poonsookiae]
MRFTSTAAATALLLASSSLPVTQAAPLFGLGALLQSIESRVESVLSSFGINITPSTDAAHHGPVFTFDYQAFLSKVESIKYAHSMQWGKKFVGWDTYKANGVNLGTWLEIEANYTPDVLPDGYTDEWSYCAAVGKATCGPVLEKHYASFVTRADIDKLAKYGINTLRIPTTYAAWYDVPGSQLYHGNQVAAFRNIAEYAISKYNMHIVLGLHSLPGGVNGLQIGEAFGHADWWYNTTNMDASLKVINNVISYIKSTSSPAMYTIAPINEPCDSGLGVFGTPETISLNGTNYLNTYIRSVKALMKKQGLSNWVMLNDAFMGASYWAPFYSKSDKIVIDSHFYYFAAAGVYANFAPSLPCGQAKSAATTLPIFVGEFSLQSKFGNTLASRQEMYQTQVYAWQKYLSGGAFWNVRYLGTEDVDGEGGVREYWNFMDLIDAGVVLPGGAITQSYC